MKTFVNAIRFALVALLFVSVTALGFGNCCNKTCAPKTCAPKRSCAPGCKLQPEPVKIRKSCDDAGSYKQVCHLEYIPCAGTTQEFEAYPKFIGCYDEAGNRIDGNGTVGYENNNGHATYTNDVQVEVITPSSATKQSKNVRARKTNGRRAAKHMVNNNNGMTNDNFSENMSMAD